MQLWILASENDGIIPYDLDEIRFRLRDSQISDDDIKLLIKRKFLYIFKQKISDASECFSETETETETETEKKAESYALLDKESLNESSLPKIETDLNDLCELLYKNKTFPKAHAFLNTMIKKGVNKRAIYHALSRCHIKKKFRNDDAWGYCLQVLKVENGNYNERDFRKDQSHLSDQA